MRIAVIGAGAWGKNIVRNLFELQALGGVCDPDAEKLNEYDAQYPGIEKFSDWQQLLASDVDGIAIATPTPLHYPIAEAALNAGKDVFIEKPITHNSQQAQALVELADKNQCILMVGHLLLYQPAVGWIKQYIDSGELGELFAVRHERLTLGRARSVENVLWDIGVHDMAVMLYLVGQAPSSVRASGHRMLKIGVEDEIHAHLEFANGVRGNLHSSWLWPEINRRTIVRCAKGMLVYDEVQQTVTLHRKWIDQELNNQDQGSEVVYRGDGQPLRLEMQHFMDRINDRQAPLSDGKSALEVIRVLERITEAMGPRHHV